MSNRSYLSDLEQLVLLSVLHLGEGAYGGRIRAHLAESAGRVVAVATIYVALSRLEQRGLVRSWMSDPLPVRGGKSKKHYAVEPAGVEALAAARVTIQRMWDEAGPALDGAPR